MIGLGIFFNGQKCARKLFNSSVFMKVDTCDILGICSFAKQIQVNNLVF